MRSLFKKMLKQMFPFVLALLFIMAVVAFSVSHPEAGKLPDKTRDSKSVFRAESPSLEPVQKSPGM